MSDVPPPDGPISWETWCSLTELQRQFLFYKNVSNATPSESQETTKKRRRERDEGPDDDEPPTKRRKKSHAQGWRTSARRQKRQAIREKKEEETCTECTVEIVGVGNPDCTRSLGTYDVVMGMHIERYTRCPKHKHCHGRTPRPIPFPETPAARHRMEKAERRRTQIILDDDNEPLPKKHACPECKAFYVAAGRPGLATECSRHRGKANPDTPPAYWELDFFDEEKDV